MKKNFLYIVWMCAAVFAVTACENDDPLDATSKHDYADGQSPYLRTNSDALVEVNLEFPKARIDESQVINLKDYAAKFHQNMKMTVDEVLDGLADGTTVFYTINPNRGVWNLDAPTLNNNGWYWNTSGTLATSTDAVASIELDKADKSLIVKMVNDPATGSSTSANLGFAINNGHDLDNYVRFKISPVVTDPSKVVTKVSIPTGDYTYYDLKFTDYTESIETNLGITINEFLTKYAASGTIGEEEIECYLSNSLGQWYAEDEAGNAAWMEPENVYQRPAYTSGGMGWWLNSDLIITTWSTTNDCFLFTEISDDGKGVKIGRYPDIASGTQCELRFLYTLANDHSRFIEFIISVTLE